VITHSHIPGRHVETEYAAPAHSKAGGRGGMAPPRDTTTSMLRATAAARTITTRAIETETGKPAGTSDWKLPRFRDVAPRVPMEGKPRPIPSGAAAVLGASGARK
jgi:hypothetical protein